MNRLLPILLFIGWLGFGGYYYVCKIKNACNNGEVEQVEADSVTQEDLSMQFALNSSDPVLSDQFDSIRGEIIDKLNAGDTLVIIGKYLESEDEGESLGMERASNVQALFADYLDESNELIAESRLESHPGDNKDFFDAIDFSIRAFGQELDDVVEESAEPEYAEEENWTDDDESGTAEESNNTTTSNTSTEVTSDAMVLHFWPESVKKDWTPSMKQGLDQLVDEMKTNPNLKAYVTGYADEMSSSDENYQLGRKRAWAVKKKMWDAGIEPTRIVTSAYKSDEITSTNDVFMSKAVVRLK